MPVSQKSMGANLSFIWAANATVTEANKLERRRRRKGEKNKNKKRLDRISSSASAAAPPNRIKE